MLWWVLSTHWNVQRSCRSQSSASFVCMWNVRRTYGPSVRLLVAANIATTPSLKVAICSPLCHVRFQVWWWMFSKKSVLTPKIADQGLALDNVWSAWAGFWQVVFPPAASFVLGEPLDVLKIHINGGEHLVLKGARRRVSCGMLWFGFDQRFGMIWCSSHFVNNLFPFVSKPMPQDFWHGREGCGRLAFNVLAFWILKRWPNHWGCKLQEHHRDVPSGTLLAEIRLRTSIATMILCNCVFILMYFGH